MKAREYGFLGGFLGGIRGGGMRGVGLGDEGGLRSGEGESGRMMGMGEGGRGGEGRMMGMGMVEGRGG